LKQSEGAFVAMGFEADVAAVLHGRLALARAIDEAAELSFLESAHFRLELVRIVQEFDDHVIDATAAAAALSDLRRRVTTVIASARGESSTK
jgi:hypothetical protein